MVKTDYLLIGAGIMSATLATLLKKTNPDANIIILEKESSVGQESSGVMNNAGTGHAGYCELNYTPVINGDIDISKAIKVNSQFQYTSKCSFLDLESIRKKESYKGKRVKRGMYKSSTGRKINADVNGSYNILRKEVPNAFSDGIEGVVVHPMIITIMN